MIHAAHGACYHWLQVGDVLNRLRGQCLLATAYAKAGLPEAALRHAERCLALSRQAGDAQTTFDRATAHGCASGAYAAAGRADEARRQGVLASEAAERLDADERQVVARLYPAP